MPDATILDTSFAVRAPLDKLSASFAYGKIVHEGLTLAIVGRPNVGKSSLFNRLVERERAIVTATPGTTRDLVSETVSIGGIPVKLVDTAGIRRRSMKRSPLEFGNRWKPWRTPTWCWWSSTLRRRRQNMRELWRGRDPALIVVENKSDLIPAENPTLRQAQGRLSRQNREKWGTRSSVATSALTGEGIADLRAAILSHIGGPGGAQAESGFLTNIRHQGLITDSLAALDAAKNAVAGKFRIRCCCSISTMLCVRWMRSRARPRPTTF